MSTAIILKVAGVSLLGLSALYLRYFETLGIQSPPHEFFYGNFRQIRKENLSEFLQKWTESYGKVYGYYEGHLPILVTSDLNMIQDIFIKQYANFSARKKFPLSLRDDHSSLSLFMSTKSKWKRMRVIINPTFSASKLRELDPMVHKCVTRLIDVLKDDNKEINISDIFKRFTMDAIWNCAFNVDFNIQNNPNNEYFTKAERVFADTWELNLPSYIGIYFYEIKHLLVDCLLFVNKIASLLLPSKTFMAREWIINRIYELVERRKIQQINRKDFIQLLIDAEVSDGKDMQLANDDGSIDLTNIHLNKKLSIEEVKQNLTGFLLAGYETTSNTLSNCAYVLAKHPEEQQRLYDEINEFFNNYDKKAVELGIDSVNRIEYLDMFIKEVLRFYPIAGLSRRCTNPTTIGGYAMPLDMAVAVDVLSIHNDPEIWGPVDPKIFYPQRFSSEIKRHPCSFLTFGLGPRNCVGMKFAMMELKIALAQLVYNYEFLPSEQTPAKLEFKQGLVRASKNGVHVMLRKRIHISF